MQGKKAYTPQLFYQLSLDRLVPQDNFYRKLFEELDFQFLYQATLKYYGREGQQSIDPSVFFKILLVGYLKRINSLGMAQANKHVMMAALSYNLKKFLRFVVKKTVPMAIGMAQVIIPKQGKDLAFLKVLIHDIKMLF